MLRAQNEMQEKLQRVIDHARERIPAGQFETVSRFVQEYYRGVAPEDLVHRDVLDLYGAALAQWNQLQRHRPGRCEVSVYNPQFEEHGWESTHTVVEVLHTDMPFLVDSVSMELTRNGFGIHLIIHPVFHVRRAGDGGLQEIATDHGAQDDPALLHESVMHFEVDRQTDRAFLDQVTQGLEHVLEEVQSAVEDWQPMRERMRKVIAEIESKPPPLDPDQVREDEEFLRWLDDNHFTYLGYREYDLVRTDGSDTLQGVPGTGLGILRDDPRGGVSQSFSVLPPEVQRLARELQLLILTKSNSRSMVHRSVNMDYVGVKRFNEQGEVTGEYRFLGLHTSAAYNLSPRQIPLLRRKVNHVLTRADTPANSHDGKALVHILEDYPRDELLQIPEGELFDTCIGILHLQERQRVRLFVRRDTFGRFISCLVFVPRESYHTELRLRMCDILMSAFNGTDIEFTVQISQSVLARVHFIVRTEPGRVPEYDAAEIEERLVEATRSWQDVLHEALLDHCGEERGNRLFRKYGNAFPAGYRENFSARTAVHDIDHMETLEDERSLGIILYRPVEAPVGSLRFKLFRFGEPIFLSKTLPMLENMGVEAVFEHPYRIQAANAPAIWIHHFGLQHGAELEYAADEIREVFQDAYVRVWRGDMENDAFNRLVLAARLNWRETTVLRAYSRYLRQVNASFSESYMASTLAGNPHIARWLVELFHARFDPAKRKGAAEREKRLADQINETIDSVTSLDEDRILRRYLAAIRATLRTNFFQRGRKGGEKRYLSLKFDPSGVPDMPAPRPAYEIFVFSPRMEGVHLRGGHVARGGLRWSDRREDFRTEILGLVKSQLVKNTIIVPVGAKGGFVVKLSPAEGGREALMKEVQACYRTLIRGLLDLTDNLVGGKLVPPPDVVRHDGDDPYLVVAADKGTATFSDLANEISKEYDYWLGDAFASGGSAGYDHKKLGITARGAWESVKRHFCEHGIEIDNQVFTVVGIGDMAGDVFGNGMLQSRNIKLIGAFNHQHIFVDPDPDPEKSYRERERMFGLPHSTWADYDSAAISPGGGVFARSEKSIPVSAELRRVLAIDAERLTPNDLIHALLCAPVDLLWNGGIGTFVKASTESHADAGDRANDVIRVDGRELRCAVVGEGGNLGLTQLGRIEYARIGGRLNTDFVDNSGGVDCSDHEVNIKILLNGVVAAGDLTEKQRNVLLAEMADEVCEHVLEHNRLRAQAISVAAARAAELLDEQTRLIRTLEREGHLDRALECLPDDEALAERQMEKQGLTRPEISVLLAYSAITLYQELLGGDIADDEYFVRALTAYFPAPLRQRFAAEMQQHRLRREIITTQVTNGLINRVGMTFVYRLREETGADAGDIARCYTVAREVFGLRRLWEAIEAEQRCGAAQQALNMLIETQGLIERATLWLLRRQRHPLAIADTIGRFAPSVQELSELLPQVLVPGDVELLEQDVTRCTADGIPEPLARQVASLKSLYSALDFVEVKEQTGTEIRKVAEAYFALGDRLGLHWLRDQIGALAADNHWQAMAGAVLRDDLYGQQSALVAGILGAAPKKGTVAELLDRWMDENQAATRRWQHILADLRTSGSPDLAMLSVAVREVRDLVQASVTPATPVKAAPRKRAAATRS